MGLDCGEALEGKPRRGERERELKRGAREGAAAERGQEGTQANHEKGMEGSFVRTGLVPPAPIGPFPESLSGADCLLTACRWSDKERGAGRGQRANGRFHPSSAEQLVANPLLSWSITGSKQVHKNANCIPSTGYSANAQNTARHARESPQRATRHATSSLPCFIPSHPVCGYLCVS